MTRENAKSTRLTLKVAEAAILAGCGKKTIRDLVARGSIPSLPHIGRSIRIPRTAFLRWIDTAGGRTTRQ
jgi:excisionase family DNA binding protein